MYIIRNDVPSPKTIYKYARKYTNIEGGPHIPLLFFEHFI